MERMPADSLSRYPRNPRPIPALSLERALVTRLYHDAKSANTRYNMASGIFARFDESAADGARVIDNVANTSWSAICFDMAQDHFLRYLFAIKEIEA